MKTNYLFDGQTGRNLNWLVVYMFPLWSCVSILLFPLPVEILWWAFGHYLFPPIKESQATLKKEDSHLPWMIGELFQFYIFLTFKT